MEFTLWGLSSSQWLELIISLMILLAAIIMGRWIVSILLDRIIRRLSRKTETMLDDVLVDVLRVPLYMSVLVTAFDYSYKRLEFLPESWESWEGDLFFILYLAVGFVFAWRFIHKFFAWYGKEMATRTQTNLDEQLMPFFRRIAMIMLWMIGIITLLGHFDIDISAMVTTLGIGSLAIALAAQESLADTISGFLILVDRPFRIGDRVEIQDLNTWGDVVDIGLRSSRIRTRDNRMVIIPNSIIGKSLVVNYSYPDTRYRIQINIGLGYGTDIEKARKVMIEAVSNVDGVLPDKPVEVLFLEFGDFSLIFRVRWWLDSYYDARRMFDKVNTALYNALNEADIELPFPQLVVRTKSEAGN